MKKNMIISIKYQYPKDINKDLLISSSLSIGSNTKAGHTSVVNTNEARFLFHPILLSSSSTIIAQMLALVS